MASMMDSMRRNLQRFVEYEMAGLVRWDNCSVIYPHDVGAEEEDERTRRKSAPSGDSVMIRFILADRDFSVEVRSSDFDPKYPCGQVLLDGEFMGPIDGTTWTTVASEIKLRARQNTAA